MISGYESVHFRADFLDHARRLVTQYDGRLDRDCAIDDVQVAVANADCHGSHNDFVGTGIRNFDVLDGQGFSDRS